MVSIGYEFKNKELLDEALTHRSFHYENSSNYSNERFEFLGDSILNFTVGEYLFKNFPHLEEGDLSKLRASIVCEEALYGIATKISLGEHLKLSKGEDMTSGRERPSILADALEAVFAAVYLDSDFESVKNIILKLMEEMIKEATEGKLQFDFKTALQELIQKTSLQPINYIITDEQGPEHSKEFFCEAWHDNQLLGKGVGKTKKDAQKEAAKQAYLKLAPKN